jgi:hypothetical protein
MSEYLMEMLGYDVQGTAEWRRGKAQEFPEDIRNEKAAEELERLSAEIEGLDNSSIEEQIADLHESINNLSNPAVERAWTDITETVSDELRSVGFHGTFATGLELVEFYRDLLQEKLHDILDEAVPVPDLNEQVENDPAVKAAKLAYEMAHAKAYNEARKKL